MIVGYIGSIGSGKTMNAVRDSVETARRRRAVIVSNIRVSAHTDTKGVRAVHQLAVGHDGIDLEHLRSIIDEAMRCSTCEDRDEFGNIIHGRPGCERYGVVVLLDEVGILMPARFWQDFPIDLIFELSQSRKSGVDFLYTAQDVEQVDAVLRRLTQYVYMVKVFPVATIERREKGRRPWFFMLTKWKPKHIETQHRSPLGRSFRLYRRHWERAYSTDELVRPPERLRARKRRQDPASGFTA
jgi:hypothetical protein